MVFHFPFKYVKRSLQHESMCSFADDKGHEAFTINLGVKYDYYPQQIFDIIEKAMEEAFPKEE